MPFVSRIKLKDTIDTTLRTYQIEVIKRYSWAISAVYNLLLPPLYPNIRTLEDEMGWKNEKHASPVLEPDIESMHYPAQSSPESWKARYDEMLDIVLMENQEEKDAAMAKIEVGKNSYVDSLRNKPSRFGFDGTTESTASVIVKSTMSGTMDGNAGYWGVGEDVDEEEYEKEMSVVEERPRRSKKGRKERSSKDRRLAVPRAEEAMDCILRCLWDSLWPMVGVIRCHLFSPRFHLVLEIFTAVALASLVLLGGDELPFRLAVLGIGLAVHGVLSLE